jgi:type IV secretion system protein VirB4
MKDEMVTKYKDILTVVEECWLPLLYPTPQKMILDVLKAGAKRGEFILLITQSPEELIKSPIFPAIVQQTSTKILLPNPNAEYKNDQGGGYSRIGLTEKEFEGVKNLPLIVVLS